MSVGKGEKHIPVASISAVQWKPAGAFVNGFIQFTVAGGVEHRSKPGSSTTDAAKDENSVLFTKKQMREFEDLRAAVQAAITAQGATASPAAPSVDVAEQLRQLAALHNEGLLTDAEYEAKRAELIARM
jgi:hypothetical protein